MKKMNKKGFTLVETLAVIVILGLIFTIAVTSVTKYITQSKKKTLISTINAYIEEIVLQVNNRKYNMRKDNVIYAIPLECIKLDKGGNNPFGEWYQASDKYWGYVLVQYDKEKFKHTFGFTFKDSAGYGMYPLTVNKIKEDGSQINTNLYVFRPKTGHYTLTTSPINWNSSGFKVNTSTQLEVLSSKLEGEKGDPSKGTCTLEQRGTNYGEVLDKVNTDYGSFEPNVPSYTTDSKYCTFEECYGDNGGQLEYDEKGGIVLDNDNAIPLLTTNASAFSDEFSIHLTFKAPFNQTPPTGSFAATILAIASRNEGKYLAWIGIYQNYLHVYSFTQTSRRNVAAKLEETGFVSIPLKESNDRWTKYDNKIINVQVTSKKGGKTYVYINNQLAIEFSSGTSNLVADQITLGDLRPYRNLKFTGTIYEIEIYNRVISRDEIQANWERSKSAWEIN